MTKCDRGEGIKNCPNLCDVIYECPLRANLNILNHIITAVKIILIILFLKFGPQLAQGLPFRKEVA